MNGICGCCEGIETLTPVVIDNRPGLDALVYRVGTHARFFKTMLAHLSTLYLDIPWEDLGDPAKVRVYSQTIEKGIDEQGQPKKVQRIFPLHGLTTRSADDPAIALLDAWATVADVLTFYQERIANEGYLRTATERRSVLELARLIGYKLKPGVAASVYLAYTLENGHNVMIATGSRAQSVPGPGELPQSFETAEELEAQAAWNMIKPRQTKPQDLTAAARAGAQPPASASPIYFQGISTNLKANDPLLIDSGSGQKALYRIVEVTLDPPANRTIVATQPWVKSAPTPAPGGGPTPAGPPHEHGKSTPPGLSDVIESLAAPPSQQPLNGARLERRADLLFGPKSDLIPQLLTTLRPELAPLLYKAWDNVPGPSPSPATVYAMRTRAAVFGHNAPLRPVLRENGTVERYEEWPLETVPLSVSKDFVITVTITRLGSPPNFKITITVDIGGQRYAEASTALQNGSFTIPLQGTPRIDATISDLSGGPTFNLRLLFREIPLDVRMSWLQGNQENVQVFSRGELLLKSEFTVSASPLTIRVTGSIQVPSSAVPTEESKVLWLDAPYGQILPDSWVVLERPTPLPSNMTPLLIRRVRQVSERARAAYGLSAKSTRIELDDVWIDPGKDTFDVIRGTAVYVQGEPLDLAEAPIDPVEQPICQNTIELDALYDGLDSGRWLIVTGERTDIKAADTPPDAGVPGVPGAELAMIAGVEQGFDAGVPGDKPHTTLRLARDLAYCYKRDAVNIYGNVVRATHGETRSEVLGSGDGSKAMQTFVLHQSPLTYVAAPTPAGAESTLRVRVNDILWHEAESLIGLGPNDHAYTTRTGDDDKTAVVFGNGRRGARLPTGVENVKAVYRTGIGRPGNVKANQISLLSTRPLGVKEVINPLPATGGADREDRDSARRNAPLAVMALERLVSVQDYEDFTRSFAGIGKASAQRLSDGRRQFVHLTIAGDHDIPLDVSSDLYRNLLLALRQFGDPHQPFAVAIRELMLLIISAKVRLHPDYLWESVEAKIRAALLDAFSFERRELGQPVFLSEVIRVIQAVPGVAYVDVLILDAVNEAIILERLKKFDKREGPAEEDGLGASLELKARVPVNRARRDPKEPGRILPAQIAFLSPDVRDTLILTELTNERSTRSIV